MFIWTIGDIIGLSIIGIAVLILVGGFIVIAISEVLSVCKKKVKTWLRMVK